MSKFNVQFIVKGGAIMAQKRFYSELRLMQKAANERMRQLEKRDIKSPAYQALQAKLEVLGRTTKGSRGRRFSETGRATYNEMEVQKKMLEEFLGHETSTVTGAKQYYEDIWTSANKNNSLDEAGISRDDWLAFWEAMPDKKDRLYGSSQIVAMVRAYSMKNGKLEDSDKMTMQEIAEEIQASKNLKDAYNKIGISYKEAQSARIKVKGK